MQKIKVITDSASDISKEQAELYNIDIIGFKIVVGDKSYREGEDIKTEEFYEILENSQELPHTSQITQIDYLSSFEKAYSQGYTDVICVVINSNGSNSYNNATMALDEFYETNPDIKSKCNITIMDSKGYTGAYGLPVLMAAKKIIEGDSADSITSFLQDWFDSSIIICTAYTLKYARKSGRVNCVAAFVGEVMGLKPIIKFIDGVSETVDKIRGNKLVIPKMVEIAKKEMIEGSPYCVLVGSDKEKADEAAKLMIEATGREPEVFLNVGATISCHLGHDVAGIVVKGENRR